MHQINGKNNNQLLFRGYNSKEFKEIFEEEKIQEKPYSVKRPINEKYDKLLRDGVKPKKESGDAGFTVARDLKDIKSFQEKKGFYKSYFKSNQTP